MDLSVECSIIPDKGEGGPTEIHTNIIDDRYGDLDQVRIQKLLNNGKDILPFDNNLSVLV